MKWGVVRQIGGRSVRVIDADAIIAAQRAEGVTMPYARLAEPLQHYIPVDPTTGRRTITTSDGFLALAKKIELDVNIGAAEVPQLWQPMYDVISDADLPEAVPTQPH